MVLIRYKAELLSKSTVQYIKINKHQWEEKRQRHHQATSLTSQVGNWIAFFFFKLQPGPIHTTVLQQWQYWHYLTHRIPPKTLKKGQKSTDPIKSRSSSQCHFRIKAVSYVRGIYTNTCRAQPRKAFLFETHPLWRFLQHEVLYASAFHGHFYKHNPNIGFKDIQLRDFVRTFWDQQ